MIELDRIDDIENLWRERLGVFGRTDDALDGRAEVRATSQKVEQDLSGVSVAHGPGGGGGGCCCCFCGFRGCRRRRRWWW